MYCSARRKNSRSASRDSSNERSEFNLTSVHKDKLPTCEHKLVGNDSCLNP
jgi:hypothetical protein